MHKSEQTILHSTHGGFSKKQIILTLAGVLVVVGGLAAATFNSLPGSPFYTLKTDFIENIDNSLRFSDESRVSLQSHLLENRLREMRQLAEKDGISPNAIETLQTIVKRHDEAFIAAVGDTKDSNTSEAELDSIARYAEIAATMETLGETDTRFGTFGDFMEEVRRQAVNIHKDKIDRFVERETPERIYEYLKAKLVAVSNGLTQHTLSEDTVDDAESYIARVEPALTEGDLPRALYSIAEAMRFIQIELGGGLIATNEIDAGGDAEGSEFEIEQSTTSTTTNEVETGTSSNVQTVTS